MQPEDQLDVLPGESVSFAVEANGTEITFQWQRNDVNVTGDQFSGDTSSTLTISNVTNGNEGSYQCIVSNIIGSATSQTAQLTVCKLNAVNPLATNDALMHYAWSLHKSIGILYRAFNTRRYTLAHGFCFFLAISYGQ